MARKTFLVMIRLLEPVAREFRKHVDYQGDVTSFVHRALEKVNLAKVPVVKVRFSDALPEITSCNLATPLHQKLKRFAEMRGCSRNSLMNAAISEYCRMLSAPSRSQRNR